jgi:uncharacterized membrane protein YidH (DUF202 family)
MSSVYDPGLQPERTLLAWRRTCLAFVLASAVAVRFTVEIAGPIAVVIGVLGALLALGAYVGVHRRYRAALRSLVTRDVLDTGALPMLAATLAALAIGLIAAVYTVDRFIGGP